MPNFTVAHLITNNSERRRKQPVEHIIALPADPLDRPSVIITEDGKMWMFGGEYIHIPNTCFFLEVQPAFFNKRIMSVLSKAVPRLERNRAA